jgi:hypothetical protein
MKVKEINRNYTTVWGGAFPAKTGAANRDAYRNFPETDPWPLFVPVSAGEETVHSVQKSRQPLV